MQSIVCIIKLSSIKKKDFSFVFKNRQDHSMLFSRGTYLSLYIIREVAHIKFQGIIRVGIAVGKKLGKATYRNKIKRRIKSLARVLILNVNNLGYYYVVVAYKSIMQANYQDLQKDLAVCLQNFN